MKSVKTSMTNKQLRFIDEYVIDSNGTQAAIRAGYSEKTAQEQASRLLSNVMVFEKIEEKREKLAKKTEITHEWIVKQLKRNHKKASKIGDFSASNKSLELIGKHLGTFSDRIQLTGKDEGAIQVDVKTKLSIDEINSRISVLLDSK